MVPEIINGSPGSAAEAIEMLHGTLPAPTSEEGCAAMPAARPQLNSAAPRLASGKTIAALDANRRKLLRFKFMSS
jgi:hypothetical protein